MGRKTMTDTKTANGLERLHPEARGLKLYKHVSDVLVACELVIFVDGWNSVNTVLRRAAISGVVKVEPFEERQDYFADVYTDEDTWEQTVLLDRKSYASLKNRWMRTRLEKEDA
jgi:hypothetical protein